MSGLKVWVPKVRKMFVAIGAASGVTAAALADGAVSVEEVVAVGVAWSAVPGVFYARNTPDVEVS